MTSYRLVCFGCHQEVTVATHDFRACFGMSPRFIDPWVIAKQALDRVAGKRRRSALPAVRRSGLLTRKAAAALGVSEDTVLRLVRKRKLSAIRTRYRGGTRYLIPDWALERYRTNKQLLGDTAEFRRVHGLDGDFKVYFRFGPRAQAIRAPKKEMMLPLEELWRLAYRPIAPAEYEALTDELREKLGIAERAFLVRFVLSEQEVVEFARRIVARVSPPVILGIPPAELKADALTHLIQKAVANVPGVAEDLERYFLRCVKHFYVDQTQKVKRSPHVPVEVSDLEILDVEDFARPTPRRSFRSDP
jgi:excisionase family DNA binding protein